MSALQLDTLDLAGNNLQGKFPKFVFKLQNLKMLDIGSNNFSGSILLSEIQKLRNLSNLDLSSNSLSIGESDNDSNWTNFPQLGTLKMASCNLKNNSNAPDSDPARPTKISGISFDWQFIITGLGFGIGAGAIVAPILFSKTVNSWYDEKVEKCVTLIFAMLGLKYVKWESDKSLYDSDSDSEEDDDMNETEEELGQGLYCVHCTKLDITRKRVIHDPKCDCHTPSVSSSLYSSASSSFSLALSEVNLR
ncbi:hypothetical protein ACFE04_000334 [Oxalis oulophora]